MAGPPTLTLVPNCGGKLMMESGPPLQNRPQMVVKNLNPVHRGIGDVPGGKPLEPVVLDLPVRSESQVSQAVALGSGGIEQVIGLLKERHADILGNTIPNCQGTLSPVFGKGFLMPENTLTPRAVLARNLTACVKKFGGTNRSIAAATGGLVNAKTVSNQMNARFDSRMDQVDAVAKVFGLRYWNLLDPLFNVDAKPDSDLSRIAHIYTNTTDQGRDSIRTVADLAAGLKPPQTPEPAPPAPEEAPAKAKPVHRAGRR